MDIIPQIFIVMTKLRKRNKSAEMIKLRRHRWLVIIENYLKILATFFVLHKNRVCSNDKKLCLKC